MFTGLTTSEADEKLKTHGFNELPSAKPKNMWHIALEVMKEPMFLLLISCGALYIILGDYKEGIILMTSILVVIVITFYQYQKTERALETLKKLSSPRALVIRDGKETRIAGREVVPGDVIILNEGDRIAADGELLSTTNLTVDEALLTGESNPVSKFEQADHNATHLVFSGTLVVQGKAIANVIATGSETQFGKIGKSLLTIEEDETRLQKEMKVMIKNLFITGAFISVGVILAFYFTRGNFIQSMLNGLASAMAILPEEFPVVLTVFLALGAWRLSRKNVLTRKPSALETLGSATILCSDKTGTITQNKMQIAELYDGKELIKSESFTANKADINELLKIALHASQSDSKDPMEKAILETYRSIASADLRNIAIKEYPLSKKLLAITRVLRDDAQDSYSVFCKGAPETVFELCKLNTQEVKQHIAVVDQMAEQGYRVIAAAAATWQGNTLPEKQSEFAFQFKGLLAFEDPIRQEVPAAIKECKSAGIKVIMITGDFPTTAKSIAEKIGMDTQAGVMTGDELTKITDDELRQKIKNINVIARAIPEHKLRIVQALKANQEIVAMTGDGVNDAPALKAANIGIAMGSKGTDVAREASSLVLLDDNFASIVAAIRLGRKIFDNLQKAMSYIIAVHIPIIGLALLPALLPSLPVLLMPLHIVFMELIIDPSCSVAFETEQEEIGIMSRPPRATDHRFFSSRRIILSALKGALLLTMVIIVYFLSIHEGHTDGEVRAIAFSSLIIGNIFLILSTLSKTRSFLSVFKEKNIAAISILLVALGLLFLIISIPSTQHIFNFQFPGYQHFGTALIGASCMLLVIEVAKFLSNKKKHIV